MLMPDRALDPQQDSATGRIGLRVLLIGASQAVDSMEAHVIDALKTLGCMADYASTRFRIEAIGFVGNALLYKATHSLFREPERLSERRLLRRAEQFELYLCPGAIHRP